MVSHITKSEKEKMLSGELYNAMEQELLKERLTAKHLIQKYNNIPIPPSASIETLKQARLEVLDSLLGSYDKSKAPYIEPPFYVDYGYNIHLGQDVYMNHNVVILDVCKVEIGDRTLIGPNVQIYTAAHPVDVTTRSTGLEFGKPVSIGSDCWLGGNCTILPGVKIGNSCIIGAGAVVTKDVADFTAVAGNPAKVIKQLS